MPTDPKKEQLAKEEVERLLKERQPPASALPSVDLEALEEVARMTSVGPPRPPGRKSEPGATWYDRLVGVNAYARAALRAAGRLPEESK